jgi:hypothetical protein
MLTKHATTQNYYHMNQINILNNEVPKKKSKLEEGTCSNKLGWGGGGGWWGARLSGGKYKHQITRPRSVDEKTVHVLCEEKALDTCSKKSYCLI